mmetsp:Transcript_25620/g.50151  ORF Transcript_25620/g.50151 Transcript_25620/m.50151 type:complete len:539 (-) Transcript_25620:309-1925(-)|eukprot:CAMPEP_0167790808 /NCGR_PEP_ID=MMETSP0111_2-20121227/11551_1 /TAXON_ID=91324 /ORGANISM="Lotharella globosa, Strain CCCM811" /LENGTH=538 /DNA_ID=CAMNT_0007683337 /DNA_START=54 /DNA_END=1670 /DNA_ORIENTATION=+
MMRSCCLNKASDLIASKQRPTSLLADLDYEDEKTKRIVAEETSLYDLHALVTTISTDDINVLIEATEELQQMEPLPCFSPEEWRKITHVFCNEVLIRLHGISRDGILRTLSQIEGLTAYFRGRVENPIVDILVNGLSYCQEQISPLSGFAPWLKGLQFSRRVKLKKQVQKLRAIRLKLQREAAALHLRQTELEKLNSFQKTDSVWKYYDSLHRQLEGSDPSNKRKDPLEPLLHLMQESLPEFETRVTEHMDLWDLHKPHHVMQHWPFYAAGAAAVLVVTQSPWGVYLFGQLYGLTRFIFWDSLLAPMSRHALSVLSTLPKGSSENGDVVATTAAALKRTETVLANLLNDYGDFHPGANALVKKALEGDISFDPNQTVLESYDVVKGLLIQIQKLRVELNSSMLTLVRMIDADRYFHSVILSLPVVIVVGCSVQFVRWAIKQGASRKDAACRLRRRAHRVEMLLVDNSECGKRRGKLERLGEMLFHLKSMNDDRAALSYEAAEELGLQISRLRDLGTTLKCKLRIIQDLQSRNPTLLTQ